MRDERFPTETQVSRNEQVEPAGTLKRALYLWERQPPSAGRPQTYASDESDETPKVDSATAAETHSEMPSFNMSGATDRAIEDDLRRHAGRLAALERIIPGDRRLDSPRFSLMMLNAFLGRAVTEGAVLARLPGLFSISDRIDTELADLELEHPSSLDLVHDDPDVSPVHLRDEMRMLFAEIKSTQKAQQRQLASSLSALHAAISDLRTHLPDTTHAQETRSEHAHPTIQPQIDELARPLIDSERLVDPRPVLAAARAAASRVHLENATSPPQPNLQMPDPSSQKPYRSALLGSVVLGALIILFGREAVQFMSASPLSNAFARP